jgi:hypothetical protein
VRKILAVWLLFAIAIPCQAQGDKPKPNTLTPKEIADGWILLFDGETSFGWTITGDARVDAGRLILGGLQPTKATFNSAFGEDFEFDYDFRGEGGTLELKGTRTGGSWGVGAANWRTYRVHSYHQKKTGYRHLTDFYVREHDEWMLSGETAAGGGTSEDVKGRFEIIIDVKPGKQIQIRNFKLRNKTMASLFNGKDLTAWKEFPGKKSKFTVTDGAITVKDGPGDLQTLGKYQDFVLQLECISHGKHLNSGIFFRCRDNEYQNGYEAQIRNEFKPTATQKYLIEEYDPKTNKLIGKKEQLFAAVDYGTGAIYRRQPARKEMSKDGE